jgi:hypothetical protein
MKDDRDLLVLKIQKLLSLANSDNEHEAKLAAEKAQELLVKHNLELQEVQNKNFEYIEVRTTTEPYLRWHQPFVIDILQGFFFVKVILYSRLVDHTEDGRRKFNKEIVLLGTRTNAKIAHYIFDYLSIVYQRLWLEYKRENCLGEKSRKSFYKGLTHGLASKLRSIRQKVQDQKGLVLVADPILNEKMKDIKSHKNHYKPIHDHAAQLAGFRKGQKIEIAKPIEAGAENKGLQIDKPKS